MTRIIGTFKAYGDGLRAVEQSGIDYAAFIGGNEHLWPAPLQDIGCMIGKRGDYIVSVWANKSLNMRVLFIMCEQMPLGVEDSWHPLDMPDDNNRERVRW